MTEVKRNLTLFTKFCKTVFTSATKINADNLRRRLAKAEAIGKDELVKELMEVVIEQESRLTWCEGRGIG